MPVSEMRFEDLISALGADIMTPPKDSSDEGVAALLAHDPMEAAEAFTGRPYQSNDIEGLLMFMHTHGNRKDQALIDRDDTVFMNGLDRYVRIITDYGFVLAGDFPFIDRKWGNRPENLYVYVHLEYGLILCFDTYGECEERGRHLNGGKVYYNWQPTIENYWSCTSSGGFHFDENDVKTWVGDHDCREGLIFNLERLRKNGEFLPQWVENPFVWFLSHDDTKDEYDYEAINRERISQMPLVRRIMQEY